jgi:hypothetical protein
VNDRVLADLAGDGDAPPRGDLASLRAALPLDIPRSPSHDELWDREAARPQAGDEPSEPVEPGAEPASPGTDEDATPTDSDVVSEALAAYAPPFEELPSPVGTAAAIPVPEPVAPAAPARTMQVRGQELGEDGPGRLVRPYAMTGGRTRSSGAEIALEALVIVTQMGRAQAPTLAWEHRAIAELCASPMSVAEVSAHLKVPLGVARVLVGDMAAEGLVEMSGASGSEAAPNDLNLLERVLNGLRAL